MLLGYGNFSVMLVCLPLVGILKLIMFSSYISLNTIKTKFEHFFFDFVSVADHLSLRGPNLLCEFSCFVNKDSASANSSGTAIEKESGKL